MSSATNTGVIGQMRKQAVRGAKVASTYIRPFSSSHGVDDCEDEYRSGEWDYLANDQEAPRFHLVAGLCMRTNPTPRVLEIGCGEGLLPERLSAHRYTEYVGVDAAPTAIERARSRALDNATFAVADATTFEPEPGLFDVIVFSEMLYYLPDPLATVCRLESGWLAPGGEIVVSQYKSLDMPKARQVWKLLHTTYDVALRTQLSANGLTWTVEALAPRR